MGRRKRTDTKPETGLSRREFLKGAGLAMSTPLLTGEGLAEATKPATDVKILGPGKVPLVLRVNGTRHSLSLEPRVTLLDALRDHLDLTGSKKVCDRATCGACTVILDGLPVYSCSVLSIEAQGKEIQTVEGLAKAGQLHPVQAAFVENDAQQCGFCTPGFVMACTAFLDKHPNPTPEEVRRGLGGNLCRCGTYVAVRAAVLQAAKAIKGGGIHG